MKNYAGKEEKTVLLVLFWFLHHSLLGMLGLSCFGTEQSSLY